MDSFTRDTEEELVVEFVGRENHGAVAFAGCFAVEGSGGLYELLLR